MFFDWRGSLIQEGDRVVYPVSVNKMVEAIVEEITEEVNLQVDPDGGKVTTLYVKRIAESVYYRTAAMRVTQRVVKLWNPAKVTKVY